MGGVGARSRWAAVGVVAAAVAARVAIFASDRAMSFDEGVYGVSVLAMRDGADPFREVFSSQGPLFLPLLRVFDLVVPGHVQALRLAMVCAAIAVSLGVLQVARRVAPPSSALLAALVAATSGTVLRAAGPVQSDGIALAFSVWAVACAMGAGTRSDRGRAILTGLLIGAGLAVKSVFVVPSAIVALWLLASDRRWDRIGMAAASGAALVVVSALPWGPANVWDQTVSYQLAISRDRNPLGNVADIARYAWRHEALLLGFLWVVVTGIVFARLWKRPQRIGERRDRAAMGLWLAASAALLVFGVEIGGGYQRYLAFLVVPAAIALAVTRPPPRLGTIVVLALVPVLVAQNLETLDGRWLQPAERRVTELLASLPDGGLVLSDEPGLAWVAGRHPPPDLVDVSWTRIEAGRLTAADVAAAAEDPQVCAVVFASRRFDRLDEPLEPRLQGYVTAYQWGIGRRVIVRSPCRS